MAGNQGVGIKNPELNGLMISLSLSFSNPSGVLNP
jgi:hypothetical protein